MNNIFLEIFKKAIVKDIVRITYNEKQGVIHSKFFLKAIDEKFYNAKTDTFNLVSHIDNKLKSIKACDILKFESANENDKTAKEYLENLAEQLKNNYKQISQLGHAFENFDDCFFDEDVKFNHLKLACMLELPSLASFENGGEDALNIMKGIWKKQCESHKQTILNHLTSEIVSAADSPYDSESIAEIKDLILSYDIDAGLDFIKTKEELFEYWPGILLPAPDFINDIYLLYISNKPVDVI